MKKHVFLLSLLLFMCFIQGFSRDYKVSSPDGNIAVTVTVDKHISWVAAYKGEQILNSSRTAIILSDGRIPVENESVRKPLTGKVNEIITPVVAHKRSSINDNYNYLTLTFRSGFGITFRIYNDGFAYRFESDIKDSLVIKNEISELSFPEGTVCWFPYESGFMSHNENTFVYSLLDSINAKHLASLPVLFKPKDVNVLITESSIEEYPGMWLRGAGGGRLTGVWPQYPAEERLIGDRNLRVTKTEDYIARVAGERTYPWRVFIISKEDGGLIESDMVFRLAAPNRLKDTDWIKPGKVAWDWWNANNLYGVDFRAGINNQTYKYYIDFASKNKLEYVILDEGWYRRGNVLDVVPGLDIPELCRYASERNVGIILWVVFKALDDKLDEALSKFEEWGVKGVKVDFMQRDDQKMVRFYYKIARKTAEHKMLVDFHGSYKPDGFIRTYPNAITREGVKGMEHSKWSKDVNPEHDVTIPFTRMVAGPMDYTPGAMVNMEKENFQPIYSRPTSQGTRVHQMAMYVIFESPLQMLSDSPSNYEREKECADFIARVPVVWDDIKVLQAKTGDYILLARKSGRNWFVGGMTDWNARELELDLSFLEPGQYVMEIFQDGVNADRYASDYKHIVLEIDRGVKNKIYMAPGGGWVAKISPK
ncbi:MAG TPA: glycoside hydrolase family 97 protein [Bacteroidales bacterium]|nr:alpha-glucosidase [Bacteroidales bacterium]HQG53079.1 glycoside hydrolase family 97 protein [Bacteroidales bacterium]HQJ21172.1 glycoside hydrolase family 97 protein [Bacteroidales bacterium]HRC88635.1 glycoside hydrolase family 97 protein [Bacteroidales bacterium]